MKPRLPTQTLEYAKRLRREMTDAELKLWQYLRAGRLAGMKFRRQHPVPPYIVDFCCVEKYLVIELDVRNTLQQLMLGEHVIWSHRVGE